MTDDLRKQAQRYKFIYSILGLASGIICVVVGAFLCILGVAGNSTMIADGLGLKTELSDAAPGVVLFGVGLLIIFLTRFKVILRERKADGATTDFFAKDDGLFSAKNPVLEVLNLIARIVRALSAFITRSIS